MKLNRSLLLLMSCVLILAVLTGSVIAKEDVTTGRKQKVSKTLGKDAKFLDVNLCEFGVSNDGILAYDPNAGGNQGLYYPAGQRYGSVLYTGGFWLVGKVKDEIRTAACCYSTEFQPGVILPGGVADDPTSDKYKTFKYNKPLAGEANPVTAEAIAQGCPSEVIGDQMLYGVYNDLGSHEFLNKTNPLGVEVQQTVWGYSQTGALNNTVFVRFRVINKGGNNIQDAYAAIFYDPDLGDANDDASGADSTNGFGFVYNGDGYDANYGVQVPAMASDFFQGPLVAAPGETAHLNDGRVIPDMRIMPQTAVFHFINGGPDPYMQDPHNAEEYYYFVQGLKSNGDEMVDPGTGKATKFWLAGDPVTSSGWIYEDLMSPMDVRFGNSTGPFQLAVGDTQDIVLGIVCGLGSDNLNSITVMRYYDRSAQVAYDKNFKVPAPPPAPIVQAGQLDGEVVLHWNNEAKDYKSNGYSFEGYNVWQSASVAGPWTKIATFDKKNAVTVIWDFTYSASVGTLLEMPVQKGADTGLQYAYTIKQDKLNMTPLVNGKPYYFAVTGYSYKADGTPKTLENSPTGITVIPQRPVLDIELASVVGSAIETTHKAGPSDGNVLVEVIDPTLVTGNDYEVSFYEQKDAKSPNVGKQVWKLTNVTTGTVVMDDQVKQGKDPKDVDWPVVEGLRIKVMGPAMTVKQFSCVANANGVINPSESAGAPWASFPVSRAVDSKGYVTAGQQVGAGKWMFHTWPNGSRTTFATWLDRTFQYANDSGGIQHLIPHDFELRFPAGGGKAVDYWGSKTIVSVPFEIWDIGIATPGDASDDFKLIPYLYDFDGNGAYNLMYDAAKPDKDAGWADHEISGGTNDPWTDPVYWMIPTDATPGTQGYDNFMAAATASTDYAADLPKWWAGKGQKTGALDAWAGFHRMVMVNWNGGNVKTATSPADYNQAMPEVGSVFRIDMTKPNSSGVDVFAFSTANFVAKKGEAVAKKRLKDINVFPNPYFAHNSAEGSFYAQFVTFNNLPANKCDIRLFSLNGELVRTISHTNGTPFERWNLLNEENIPVGSGMYFAHISTEYGNVILKLAVINRGAFFRNL